MHTTKNPSKSCKKSQQTHTTKNPSKYLQKKRANAYNEESQQILQKIQANAYYQKTQQILQNNPSKCILQIFPANIRRKSQRQLLVEALASWCPDGRIKPKASAPLSHQLHKSFRPDPAMPGSQAE